MQNTLPALQLISMLVPLFFMALMLFFIVIMIAGTAFWTWMIVDCVQNEPSTGNDKVVWLLLLIFTHFVGALIYFFARRGPRRRQFASLPTMPRP
jgi:hypothetical protein